MSRRPSNDPTSPMTFSLPKSLQDQIRAFIEQNPAYGSASLLVKRLLVEFLANHKAPPTPAPIPVITAEQLKAQSSAIDPFNNGLPPGFSPREWVALTMADSMATPDAQGSVVDMVKTRVNPALDRERAREELRKRDPEGWKKMQEEHEARLRAALEKE